MDEKQIGKAEFIDKCTARWLFEKTSVAFYDQALKKCPERVRERFREIRGEEKNHEDMLEEIIRTYGAKPETLTPSARITQLETAGIVNVVNHENYEAILDALLAAELVDNAGWELLVRMAEELDLVDVLDRFEDALDVEQEHLDFVRDQVLESAIQRLTPAA